MLFLLPLSDVRSLDVTGSALVPLTSTVQLQFFLVGLEVQILDPMAALAAHLLLSIDVVVVAYSYHTRMLVEPCMMVLSSLLARVEAQLFLSPLSAVPDRFVYLVLLSSLVSGPLNCRDSNYRLFHLGDCRVS